MAMRLERTHTISYDQISEEDFKKMVTAAMKARKEDRASILELLSPCFCKDQTLPRYAVVKDTEFIEALAQSMKENKQDWAHENPEWITSAIDTIYHNMQWEIPLNQTKSLLEAIKEYLLEQESDFAISLLHRIATPLGNKQMVLQDLDVYPLLKRIIKRGQRKFTAVRCLQAAVLNSPEWQFKVLKDKEFVLHLLDNPTVESWAFLSIIAQHEDAKGMFPPEVLTRAKAEDTEHCINICAILCNEAEAACLKLSSTYVQSRVQRLEELIEIRYDKGRTFPNSLLSLVLPFVNLSISDAAKEPLGKQLVGPLLKVLAIMRDKPLISKIELSLDRSKQAASRALWNLAFYKGNLTIIEQEGGTAILESLLGSKDTKIACNVAGTLYMMGHKRSPYASISPPIQQSTKHVMISYNWSNQPTVLRIVDSLKKLGYRIWVDVEKMGGSTLEAMAGAIEGAEIVLMCMSQKYKDSPNCRLEGEYCVNRKVKYIPLMMQQDYFPDGWLGITLGTKMWHDFSSEDNWNVKMGALNKDMGGLGKAEVHRTDSGTLFCEITKTTARVEHWRDQELDKWMETHGIIRLKNKFIEQGIYKGTALLELNMLLQGSNNCILTFLKEGLGTQKMGDVLDVVNAIKKLV